MILEIELQKNTKIFDCYKTLMSFGDFVIENNVVYLNTIIDISKVSSSLPIEKCRYITNTNYSSIESMFPRKWCKEILYKAELSQFEKSKECQERLKYINNQLDILEKWGKEVAKEEKFGTETSS